MFVGESKNDMLKLLKGIAKALYWTLRTSTQKSAVIIVIKRHIFADLYRPVAYKVSRLLEVKSRIWLTLLIAHLLSQSLMR